MTTATAAAAEYRGGEGAQSDLTFINDHRHNREASSGSITAFTDTRPGKMVAVHTSPNSSPSAEWICCLDKRWVNTLHETLPRRAFTHSNDCVFSNISLSFIRGNVIHRNRRSLRVHCVCECAIIAWYALFLAYDRLLSFSVNVYTLHAVIVKAAVHNNIGYTHKDPVFVYLHGQKGVGGFEVHRDVSALHGSDKCLMRRTWFMSVCRTQIAIHF